MTKIWNPQWDRDMDVDKRPSTNWTRRQTNPDDAMEETMTTTQFKGPDGGQYVIDVRRTAPGKYEWHTTAFLGQHGDSFGTIEADTAVDARLKARDQLIEIIRRKHAYEQFYEAGRRG